MCTWPPYAEDRRCASRPTIGSVLSVGLDCRTAARSCSPSDRRRNSVLWRVRASGGEPERIAGVGENAADPAFSRDGRMAYAQVFQDANIWRIDDGGKAAARQGDLLDAVRFEPAILAGWQPRGIPLESIGKQRDLGERQQRTGSRCN